MQTLVQDKLCPLRTTQWFLLLKKSEKTCSRLPEIPFFFQFASKYLMPDFMECFRDT